MYSNDCGWVRSEAQESIARPPPPKKAEEEKQEGARREEVGRRVVITPEASTRYHKMSRRPKQSTRQHTTLMLWQTSI